MKNLGIKAQLILLGILPITIVTIVLTAYSIRNSMHTLEDSLKDRGNVIATQLAPASEYGVVSGNLNFLQPLIQQAMSHEPDILSILITDQYGRTLAVSGRPIEQATADTAKQINTQLWELKDRLVFSAPVFKNTINIDDFTDESQIKRDLNNGAIMPVIGQVYVSMSQQRIVTIKQKLIARNLFFAGLSLCLTALIAWRIGRKISRPIESLADAVNRIGKGHFELRIDENSIGEIHTLQKGFNHMASRLAQSHDYLQDRIEDATIQLSYQAQHDELTGLVNRREFEHRLESALFSAKDQNYVHVFCYMDLDQFKIVNDTCGHQAGDELLRQISLILSNRVRDTDTLARLGGDEFGLLLENCTVDVAIKMVEDLRMLVQDFRFVHGDKIFRIGVSIGMVPITKDTISIGKIMATADSACYTAKDNGRNRIHVYEALDDELNRRQGEMEWVNRINQAIEDDRFCLYCQPIIPFKEFVEKPLIFEILIRKLDTDDKLIPPMAFIPAAERYHLMPLIDRWVIKNTFSTYRDYLNVNNIKTNHLFSINLSGVSLGDKYLLEFIKEQFEFYQVSPNNICFEITETAAIVNLTTTIYLINALKGFGCKFLLDDFGSGMSSFAYLKNLPVDFLKMDGSYVQDITHNDIDFAMVKSIHSIAEAMHIKTIAEFVESTEAVQLLKDIGVDYGQGFFLGKPVPLESILKNINQLDLII